MVNARRKPPRARLRSGQIMDDRGGAVSVAAKMRSPNHALPLDARTRHEQRETIGYSVSGADSPHWDRRAP